MWFGLAGVVGFAITLPATRVAVGSFDPMVVTLGRALLAALLAGITLLVSRQRRPTRAEWVSLAVVAAGVILGFPFLSALALRQVPASHSGVVIGLLPLATAAVAAMRGGERPSRAFWLTGGVGSLIVIAFGLREGGGRLQLADLALLGAVLSAAVGYAEGGRLARTLGSWQVICWALLLAAPFAVVPFLALVARHGMAGSTGAWVGFAYLGVVSQFAAFVAWYKGMALSGVARTSQLQLLQPFLTVIAAAFLLGEPFTAETLVASVAVAGAVALARRAPVQRVKVHENESSG
jgi:drug/metabolite transporter (DMT)-like permease